MKKSSIAILLTVSATWAGLCNDIGTSAIFKAQTIQEYIWEGIDVQALSMVTETNTLNSPNQVKVIENSLNYEIPAEITIGCQWTSSTTKVYKNTDGSNLVASTKTEFYKVRDAKGLDVDNDGGVKIDVSLNYWLHQVTNPADTTTDGFETKDSNTVYLQGSYYSESETGNFDMWYATVFIKNEDTTTTSKLENSYILHRDSASALAAIQTSIPSEKYPYPEFRADLQLLRIRFSSFADDNVKLTSQDLLRSPFQIEDGNILWNQIQASVAIFKIDGSLLQQQSQVTKTLFSNLPRGQYIVKANNMQFRINK